MGCVSSSDTNASEGDSDIDKLNFPPTTPIGTVFNAIVKCCGINEDTLSDQYIERLNKLWYYRSYDLIKIEKAQWDTFDMPLIFEDQLFKYIQNCQKNNIYIDFKEPIPKNKNITHILNDLKSDNTSESTSNDIKILNETFDKLYLLNIDKLKKYLHESILNEINVPEYLKIILLQKIDYKFEVQNNNVFINELDNNNQVEGEKDILFCDMKQIEDDIKNATDRNKNVYMLPATCTMSELCTFLADELFSNKDRISNDLAELFRFNYNRLYHLARINDEFYDKIMANVSKYLANELYDMITNIRACYVNPLPFYNYNYNINSTVNNYKEIDIDWTMKTYDIYKILEKDLNLSEGELSKDCDLMMNNFYSNLWDWFFIPNELWKKLPYFNKYHVVRNRIEELMKLCMQKYNMNNILTIPILPKLWLNKYNINLSVEQILFGRNKKQFMFDGLNWNEFTTKHIQLIYDYFNKNYIGKLQFIAAEHCKKNDIWTEYMNNNQIPSHIRFKINFYSIKGNIQTNDEWLNKYIKTNYLKLPPQYKQINIHVPIPVFYVETISACKADIRFAKVYKYECFIEIMDENEKESNWKHLESISHKMNYLCQNLEPNNSYQIKVRCKENNLFGSYSEIKRFTTKTIITPVFSIANIGFSQTEIRFDEVYKYKCFIEIMDENSKESNWKHLETICDKMTYLCQNLKQNNSYQIKVRCEENNLFGSYSEIKRFTTKMIITPVFFITNISFGQAEIRFAEVYKHECFIEIMDENEKESNWKHLETICNKINYLCQNLKHNNSYQIRVRCKDNNEFGRYSEIKTFSTKKGLTFNVGPNGSKWKFSNGNIIKKISCAADGEICVIGESINNKMCTQFDLEIKLKRFTKRCYIGYIASTINESYIGYIASTIKEFAIKDYSSSTTNEPVQNWNRGLNSTHNCVALELNPMKNYIVEHRNGKSGFRSYAPNLEQGDRFKYSFHFGKNQLTIYHNESKVEILSLDNCKTITPAVSMWRSGEEIEIIKYDIVK